MSPETILQLVLTTLTLLLEVVRFLQNRAKVKRKKSKKISAELSFKFKQK